MAYRGGEVETINKNYSPVAIFLYVYPKKREDEKR